MKHWSFNSLLFNRLSEVLDISGTGIANRCGLTQQVFSRYTTNETVVSVQVLIKICNCLRMPAHFFVAEDNNYVIPNRESATIGSDRWKPVWWDEVAVERTFGDGGRIYWKDVADVMGLTPQKPHARFLLRTRFPVTDFLTVCNYFSLSPFTFLIDNNRETSGRENERRTAIVPLRDDRLSAEIDALRRDIGNLSSTVADLKTKYESLLQAHERLLSRINVNIGTINSSNIGIAADPVEPR